uniref:Uncharacterized protein n=1 Tax=Arundo donax TaxID=35708 RepID=A0A0A9Q1V5_ARUDO
MSASSQHCLPLPNRICHAKQKLPGRKFPQKA